MNFAERSRKVKKSDKFKEQALLVVIGVTLFWALFHYEKIFQLLGTGMKILAPFIIGAVIAAYHLQPPGVRHSQNRLQAGPDIFLLIVAHHQYADEGPSPGRWAHFFSRVIHFISAYRAASSSTPSTTR